MINFAFVEALLLFSYLAKFLYFSPGYSDAMLIGLLTAMYLSTQYHKENKKLEAVKEELKKQQLAFQELDKKIENLSNHVSSLKVNQLRTTTVLGKQ